MVGHTKKLKCHKNR